MAKKQIDNPLFLEFINIPIFKRTYTQLPSFSESTVLKYKNYIRSLFNQLLEEGNLPPDHAVRLEIVIEDFENFTPEYIKSICKIWLDFKEFIGFLNYPEEKYSNWMNYISWSSPFRVNANPTIRWEDNDRFQIGLDTGDEVNPNTAEPVITSEIVKFLSVEFAEFLVNHYRRGIFAYCGLDDCSRYIITTNGRKYCCESHKQAAYIKKLKDNKLKKEYRKIRVRLYRQYKRHPFLENKMSLEKFLLEKWPPEKLHLYHRFSRSSKK